MAEFEVKVDGLNSVKGRLDAAEKSMEQIRSEIDSVNRNLGFKITNAAWFHSHLTVLSRNVSEETRILRGISKASEQIARKYDVAERKIAGNTEGGSAIKHALDILAGFLGDKIANSSFIDSIIDNFNELEDFSEIIINSLETGNLINLALFGPDLLEWVKKFPSELKNEFIDDIINNTKLASEGKTDWQFWGASTEGKYGSAGVSALAGDAYYSAEAGLFQEDEDENLIFNPNITAKAGVSMTALSAYADGHIGNDDFGASASGNVDVGRLSAKGAVTASMLDENGYFNPTAKLDASAEAVLVEAKGEAGVNILGAEAKVRGSVNVGVGAHANVGFENGVISFDIGASLGVGASIGFEVDIGGIVNTVQKASKSILDFLGL